MLRLVKLTFVLIKYSIIYLLIKFHLYLRPKEKVARHFFEEAGGSFIKFGQLLALRVDIMPKKYSIELLSLFDNVRPFPYSQVSKIFVRELGAYPEHIFKDFQKKPFAAASFGQVHAAKLEDDTIVAVKILRPGIEQDIMIDFIFINVLAYFGDLFFKLDALPWKEIAKEFKKWTLNELDYRIEADNAEIMYEGAKGAENVIVPKTYRRYSTERILVQEYIEGIPLSRALRGLRDGRLDAQKLEKMGIDIKKAPKTLVAELFRQYFFVGSFHADPHPGNILLLKHDKIALLDFGILGQAIKYNRKSFVKWLKYTSEMNFEDSTYHAAHFSASTLKQLIGSALPANVNQETIDTFIHMLADHFAKEVRVIVEEYSEELKVMNKDYTAMLVEIIKSAQSLKVKLPNEITSLLRALSIIGFLAKEMDYDFHMIYEMKRFFAKYSLEEIIGADNPLPFKRMNRERAIEQLNNWLAYLFEKDQNLYSVVKKFMATYNKAQKSI